MASDNNLTRFPVMGSNVIYLNHAGSGPLPAQSAAAMKEAVDELSLKGPNFEKWIRAVELSRKNIAVLLGVDVEGIGFLQNTAQAISTIARGLSWKEGDEVIVPAVEYPANQYPWLALRGVGVKVVSVQDSGEGTVSLEAIEKAFTSRTRLVAISHVQYGSGFRTDLESLSRMCHARGTYVLVDVIQSLGALPIDAGGCDIDFVAAGAHKWLLSPPGIGILYVKPELIERVEPVMVGALSVCDRLNFESIRYELPSNAQRFESGTANFPGFTAMEKSTQILRDTGIETVARKLKSITDYLCNTLNDNGYRILSSRSGEQWSGIVSFTKHGIDIRLMERELIRRGVIFSVRRGALRFSPHYYTTCEQIDRCTEIIREVERSI